MRILPSSPVTALKGVAAGTASRLSRLDVHTVLDLLLHLPSAYQDRSRIAAIGSLRAGDVTGVRGEVLLTQMRPGRRATLTARITDGTGILQLRFFNPHAGLRELLARGARVHCYGEVRGAAGMAEMVHPECREDDGGALEGDAVLIPVYPATAGLHQATLRSIVGRGLQALDIEASASEDAFSELLPDDLLRRHGLPRLRDALLCVHRPPLDADAAALLDGRHPARRRLSLEELVAHQLSMRSLRERRGNQRAPVIKPDEGGLRDRFLDRLPFRLTAAQRRVIDEIDADLALPHPMQRLLQGDVGSGKTAVAAAAALAAVESGYQAVVMAPTELLAEQHYRNLRQWLDPIGVELRWLSGGMRARERQGVLADLTEGTAQVIVGTHALFQEDVVFARLGLLVIDEQHRFGVHQRLALREKGRTGARYPHQLIMTATPIPRTLMMTGYADLDCSVIDELPPGRQPITTVVLPDTRRDEVLERVREACRQGRQAYWVCTLIEESEALQCQAATETAATLMAALSGLTVGLVHGRLKPAEKEAAMTAFKRGDIDLLVATTVIEVGVDVPNASLMIVENAERLGLAQLHQLRGRVGRGSEKSACVLMYHSPLSERGRARLAVLRDTADGFAIAARDLELRGPGELLGVRQAGEMRLRAADLRRDGDLVPLAAETAERLLRDDPLRSAALVRRWLENRPQYGAV
ncbi:MAG: ATP-dependent DNA helicase RecG [Gammaproteobacteria bacterium]|nr:ATP-dependent DNA helicase RecG [Gammaproteobacteria bacterium]